VDTELDAKPDPESKIWRLSASEVLVLGIGYGVNLFDSAQFWKEWKISDSHNSAVAFAMRRFSIVVELQFA